MVSFTSSIRYNTIKRSSLLAGYNSVSSRPAIILPLTRSYAAPAQTNRRAIEGQVSKELAKKKEAARMMKLRAETKTYTNTPLYFDVPTALRFIRASEVGSPVNQTTINMTFRLVAEKGTAMLQGSIPLPKPLRQTKICVFTSDERLAKAAKEAGAHLAGSTEVIEAVKKGEIDFELAFATPDVMGQLGPIARALGPKGLMPNAKRGTVTDAATILEQVREQSGAVTYKQKADTLSVTVGRVNFTDAELARNILTISQHIKNQSKTVKSKKPVLIGKTILSSLRSPGIVISV
ncbi:ribosomal protein L1 [Nadsonia fulvescens var. elongata DSM 6958]|uniref:Ribosomal protein n=1 Tax=Nadsonia fulvescens var. elongata DSM 6958 TaxID=857566 RepID=A0A1E3PS20_9ASCO|nr:ribosomal protein L1 [Nadsonia fulvescens var. elongata DSM 6958]